MKHLSNNSVDKKPAKPRREPKSRPEPRPKKTSSSKATPRGNSDNNGALSNELSQRREKEVRFLSDIIT